MEPPSRIEVEDGTERGARLGTRTRRMARAMAEALFSPEGGAIDEARLSWLEGELDDFVARAGRHPRTVLTASLAAIERLAPLAIGRATPFHRLPVPDRARALAALERSPLGLAILGAKAMICIVWYEHPASRAEIGHGGRCLAGAEAAE